MTRPERILIFSPHPDDVELFLGGTLLKYLSDGATIKIVIMSYGEKGSILSLLGDARKERLKQERMAELRSRLDLAPALTCSAMELPDMGITKTEQIVDRCVTQFSGFEPTCVYLPESALQLSLYRHSDHIVTGQIVESAVTLFSREVILRYFHSKHPNIFVDISPFYVESLRALRCYKSQYRWSTGLPFLLHIYEADRYVRLRRYGKVINSRFAEAFREVRPRNA